MASAVANGNVKPSRFVKIDTSVVEGKVLQASTGDKMFGISQEGTRRAPLTGLDDGYAAIAGENVNVYASGDSTAGTVGGTLTCWLKIGTGGATNGDYLKSDSDGAGVTTTSSGDWVGAQALQTVVAGQLCRVKPVQPWQF